MLRLLLVLLAVGVAGEGANSTDPAPSNATQSQGIFSADDGAGGEAGDGPVDVAEMFANATATGASHNSTETFANATATGASQNSTETFDNATATGASQNSTETFTNATATGASQNSTETFGNATATGASQNSTPVPTAPAMPLLTPTSKPTMRCRPNRPCPPPPTPRPTSAPTQAPLVSSPIPLEINLVIYVENVPARLMSDKEAKDYVQVMTDFLKGDADLNKNGIRTSRLVMVGHGIVPEEEEGCGGSSSGSRPSGCGTGQPTSSPSSSPNPNSTSSAKSFLPRSSGSFVYSYNSASRYVPQTYPAVYILTRVEVSTKLPPAVVAFFLWDELRQQEATLIAGFYAKRFFNSYFKAMTSISGEVVERLTKRPTQAPTRAPTAPPTAEEAVVNYRDAFMTVGVALGCLWILLTLCGFGVVRNYRRQAKQHLEMAKMANTSAKKRSFRETVKARTKALESFCAAPGETELPSLSVQKTKLRDKLVRVRDKARTKALESFGADPGETGLPSLS